MITVIDFRKIDLEVKDALEEAFRYAQSKEKDKNDFYLFLSNASYIEDHIGTNVSPYVIDNRLDLLADSDRFDFLTKYLKTYYGFSGYNTSDSKESLTIEMMMYSHIWESRNFLKSLKRLTDLSNSEEYEWNLSIPDAQNSESKQNFIRKDIRDELKKHNLKIAEVISKGYRSQFRNAFAHSDYSFAFTDDRIILHNYKPGGYEVQDINFDVWTKYFCYSFLLNYYMHVQIYNERQKISSLIEVTLRDKDGNKKPGEIEYDSERNSFTGTIYLPK